jgi:hypothetical protein
MRLEVPLLCLVCRLDKPHPVAGGRARCPILGPGPGSLLGDDHGAVGGCALSAQVAFGGANGIEGVTWRRSLAAAATGYPARSPRIDGSSCPASQAPAGTARCDASQAGRADVDRPQSAYRWRPAANRSAISRVFGNSRWRTITIPSEIVTARQSRLGAPIGSKSRAATCSP